jgi:hypothetical protein
MPYMGYGMYYDSTWFIFVLPALLIGLLAQAKVSGAYNIISIRVSIYIIDFILYYIIYLF